MGGGPHVIPATSVATDQSRDVKHGKMGNGPVGKLCSPLTGSATLPASRSRGSLRLSSLQIDLLRLPLV